VFDSLWREIDELRIPVDGPALIEALGALDRLEAKISAAVGAFDEAELWDIDGATSMIAWMRDQAGMGRRVAAKRAGVARKLKPLPVTAAAWAGGSLSGGQVEAIVAHLDSATAERFAAQEADLVPLLAPLSVDDTARAMDHWKARVEAEGEDAAEPEEPERSLHLSRTLGGTWVGDFVLDPEGGEVVATAVRLAQGFERGLSEPGGEPRRTAAQRRADALVDVCRFYLDNQRSARGGRHRPHLNVVVDIETLAQAGPGHFADGSVAPRALVQRLLCDCALHRVVTAGRSAILDYGTTKRTLPAPLWNALVVRDEHCRWPGCDRPPNWSEGHHVTWVTKGGPTNLDNLVLCCVRHHHRLHQPGWGAKLLPDATLEVTDPDGRVRTSHPPRAGPTLWEAAS